jgi:PIN domain nuclease of toxin-antitoxin system
MDKSQFVILYSVCSIVNNKGVTMKALLSSLLLFFSSLAMTAEGMPASEAHALVCDVNVYSTSGKLLDSKTIHRVIEYKVRKDISMIIPLPIETNLEARVNYYRASNSGLVISVKDPKSDEKLELTASTQYGIGRYDNREELASLKFKIRSNLTTIDCWFHRAND